MDRGWRARCSGWMESQRSSVQPPSVVVQFGTKICKPSCQAWARFPVWWSLAQGSTHAALNSGAQAAIAALEALGHTASLPDLPNAEDAPQNQSAFWHVEGKARAWVDFQNEVTIKNIKLAHHENMRPAEHLKRWTTWVWRRTRAKPPM